MEILYLFLATRLWAVNQHSLVEVVILHQAVGEAHPVWPHRIATAVVVIGCKHARNALGKQDGNCQNGTTCRQQRLGPQIRLPGGHKVIISVVLQEADCSLVYGTDTCAPSRVMGSESRASQAQEIRFYAHVRVS